MNQYLKFSLITGLLAVSLLLSGCSNKKDDYESCLKNLAIIGTACEMYKDDHSGCYPASLSQITPDYLKSIPKCPAAGIDTYSDSYAASANQDAYSFFCSGCNHKGFCDSCYPQFNSIQGTVTR